MSDDNDPIEVPEPKCPICDGTGINTYIEKDEIGLNTFAHYPCQCRKESREDEGYDLLKTLEYRLISKFVSEYDDFLEVINGIMFQLGFQGIKISNELRTKWKDIQNRKEKWEEKLK